MSDRILRAAGKLLAENKDLKERIHELETLLGFVVSGDIQRVNTELHKRIIKALENRDE